MSLTRHFLLPHTVVMGSALVTKKCVGLSMEEVDDLFFPGRGGKSKKAAAFCSDCPFRSSCLREAIAHDDEGFYAGYTKQERTEMASFIQGLETAIINVDDYLPTKKKKRRIGGRKIVRAIAHADYLDNLEPTEEELLALSM